MFDITRARMSALREQLRANYWLVPTIMVVSSVALAFLTLAIDEHAGPRVRPHVSWIYAGSADGARSLLSIVAGSMLTVAGIVFSINILVLTMASAQFGPRLLSNFVRDIGSQVTLGTFTSTFVYCLLILRVVRQQGEPEGAFVPYLSVATGTMLAAVGMGVLIYFIHHVAVSIQAPYVVANVGLELESAVREQFPKRLRSGERRRSAVEVNRPSGPSAVLLARRSGYIQTVDLERLVEIASTHDLVFSLDRRPGDFIIEGTEIMQIWPFEKVTTAVQDQLWRRFHIGRRRTPSQDIEFAVYQLAEVAVRTLSPAMNDPFTAMSCIDWLSAALEEIYQRDVSPSAIPDCSGKPRLYWHPTTHSGVTDSAFNQIRQYGRNSVAVTIRLLEALRQLAAHAQTEEEHATLSRHADMVIRSAREAFTEPNDIADAEQRYDGFRQQLNSRARQLNETAVAGHREV